MGEQPARDFIDRFTGSLEPLAGLNQLQTLILEDTRFTGQSVSEICLDTTHGDFHSLSVSDRHAPANQRLSSIEGAKSF